MSGIALGLPSKPYSYSSMPGIHVLFPARTSHAALLLLDANFNSPYQLLLWQTYQTNVRSGDLLLPRACLLPGRLPPNCHYPCGGTSMLAPRACQFTLARPTRLPRGGYRLLPTGDTFQCCTRPRGQTTILFHRPIENHHISPRRLLRTRTLPQSQTP